VQEVVPLEAAARVWSCLLSLLPCPLCARITSISEILFPETSPGALFRGLAASDRVHSSAVAVIDRVAVWHFVKEVVFFVRYVSSVLTAKCNFTAMQLHLFYGVVIFADVFTIC